MLQNFLKLKIKKFLEGDYEFFGDGLQVVIKYYTLVTLLVIRPL